MKMRIQNIKTSSTKSQHTCSKHTLTHLNSRPVLISKTIRLKTVTVLFRMTF